MTQIAIASTTLAYPQSYQFVRLPVVSEFVSMNGTVKRDRRNVARTAEYRIQIRWEAMTTAELDALETVFNYLHANSTAAMTTPDGQSLTVQLDDRDRNLRVTPYITANDSALFQASILLYGWSA